MNANDNLRHFKNPSPSAAPIPGYANGFMSRPRRGILTYRILRKLEHVGHRQKHAHYGYVLRCGKEDCKAEWFSRLLTLRSRCPACKNSQLRPGPRFYAIIGYLPAANLYITRCPNCNYSDDLRGFRVQRSHRCRNCGALNLSPRTVSDEKAAAILAQAARCAPRDRLRHWYLAYMGAAGAAAGERIAGLYALQAAIDDARLAT